MWKILAMFALPALIFICCGAAAEAEGIVTYVSGSAAQSGDGTAAASAFKTMEEAYGKIAAESPEEGGTVVVCGETRISGSVNLENANVKGTVHVTSVHDGCDYAVANGAALVFDSKSYIYFGEKTLIDNITMNGNAGTVYFFCGYDMTLGENINSFGTIKLFTCNFSPATSAKKAGAYALTVESGSYDTIFMGSNTAKTYTGNTKVSFGGNAAARIVVVGANKGHTGDLTFHMTGGTVSSKICNTANSATSKSGKVTIDLLGGSVKSMVAYNSSIHYATSATVTVDTKNMTYMPASMGGWDTLYLPGTTTRVPLTLNYLNYNGTAASSNGFDTVNLFGGSMPGSYFDAGEEGKTVLCVHGYTGNLGADISQFHKLAATDGSSFTCAGEVPEGTILFARGSTLRIRPSQNPGKSLSDYIIEENDKVIMEEPPYTAHDVIFSMDFENGTNLTSGSNVQLRVVSNGYASSFEKGGLETGFDGNTCLHVTNNFGKQAENYLTFDLSQSGFDITRENYTVSLWFKTKYGSADQWGRSVNYTTAGTPLEMAKYNMGGVVFSNQDTFAQASGFTCAQLPIYKYGAMSFVNGSGQHSDTDGIWQTQDDRWHHMAVAIDRSGSYRMFIDGQVLAVKDISPWSGESVGENKLVFGADAMGQYGLENAYLDNIKVFSGALDTVDVEAEYYSQAVDALAWEITTHTGELGEEYAPFIPAMEQTCSSIRSQAQALQPEDYKKLMALEGQLRKEYEEFLAKPQPSARLTMLLASDIHLGASSTGERFRSSLAQLKEMGIKLDVLLSAGDFADNPTTPVVTSAFDTTEDILSSLGMADTLFVNSLGNHEGYWKAPDANFQTSVPIYWERMMKITDSMTSQGKATLDSVHYYVDDSGVLQHCSYAVTTKGFHFLVINTDYLPQTGNSADVRDENGNYSIEGNKLDPIRHTMHITDESFEWMKATLDKWAEDGEPVFAVSHYLFENTCPLSFGSPIAINSNTVGNQDQQLRALLAGYDNVFYFCGHLHTALGVIKPWEVTVPGVGSFMEINLSSMKEAARGYRSIPSTWIAYVYDSEIVLRARDFAQNKWIPQFDEVLQLKKPEERQPLVITRQPENQFAVEGQVASFAVEAEGRELSYRWFCDRLDGSGWTYIQGADTSVYTTSQLTEENNGYKYMCQVTDKFNQSANTTEAVLTVSKAPDMPKTGDNSRPWLWLTTALLAIAGMMAIYRKQKN